jgi:ATP-dependent DNA helicase RecG
MTNPNNIPGLFLQILNQEVKFDYLNNAVIGGIDQFIQFHKQNIQNNIIPQKPYLELSIKERKAWIHKTINTLSISKSSKTTAIKNKNTNKLYLSDLIDKSVSPLTKKHCELLRKSFSINTLQDLIMHLPDRHDDYSIISKICDLKVGEKQSSELIVKDVKLIKGRSRTSVKINLYDETGKISCVLFNQPWVVQELKNGVKIMVSGKISLLNGSLTFQNPSYEIVGKNTLNLHTGRLVPIYPLTEGIRQKTIRKGIYNGLVKTADQLNDFMPSNMLKRLGMYGLKKAITQYHYPDNYKNFQEARRRLAFNELFLIQLFTQKRKNEWSKSRNGITIDKNHKSIKGFFEHLPFTPTDDQLSNMSDISDDLSKGYPMRRLLQGDVGSGKTLVAVFAMMCTAFSGFQSALMAPTEVLAEQHFMTISKLIGADSIITNTENHSNIITIKTPYYEKDIVIGLLTGGLSKSKKMYTQELLSSNGIDIVIGTHAIIQESVTIPSLGLIIVDEQHRFGVKQRNTLDNVIPRPHLLVMSATPIPRSLLLTMAGDLDLSIIKQMPSGRKPIETIRETSRERVYKFIREQVNQGRQAFIVFALVEDSETIQARSAIEEHLRLSDTVFPGINIGLLHGRMTISDKELVMEKFRNGSINVLVSTSVIEVGVDVPNATVMFIDGADRFGISQLHQFRGRVGRGEHQSYCILMSDHPSEDANLRIEIMRRINDGFLLAEEDFKLRGPGDYLGTRQSGAPVFKVASLIDDRDILTIATVEAKNILDNDIELTSTEHRLMNEQYEQHMSDFLVS